MKEKKKKKSLYSDVPGNFFHQETKCEAKYRNSITSNILEKHASLVRELTFIVIYWPLLVCINTCIQKMKCYRLKKMQILWPLARISAFISKRLKKKKKVLLALQKPLQADIFPDR